MSRISFISERTKSALAQRKASGVKPGRQKGAIVKSIYDEHKDNIVNYSIKMYLLLVLERL